MAKKMTPPEDALDLSLDQIEADPDQPRKHFDPGLLRELGASIAQDGLLQPITVVQIASDRYRIVAGERRWRAHHLIGASTIRALVTGQGAPGDILVKQIIENDQRADVTPLEQARSYQRLMDAMGWSVEEIAKRLGKAPHRITERTDLLKLEPEFQKLLAAGQIQPSQATELIRVGSQQAQGALFKLIRTGKVQTYADLRAAGTALIQAQAQLSLLGDSEPPQPTAQEVREASSFGDQVERIAALLRSGISDNQIVAVKKVNRDRAGYFADMFRAMQADMRRIELAMREAMVQATLLGEAAD